MRALDSSHRADVQIWGHHYLHAMNISDETVTGQERLGGPKADVGGVSTSLYKLRPLATIGPTGALAVPAELYDATQELNRYHHSIRVNELGPKRIISIEAIDIHGYSGAIHITAPSVQRRLKELGITNINGFIESKNIQYARQAMGLVDSLGVRSEIVDMVNTKGIFLDAMTAIGVPTAPGKTVHTEGEAYETFERLKKQGAKQIYAKLGRAASGQGVFCIDRNSTADFENFMNLAQTQEQLHSIGIRLDYGIEGIIDSPNVMIFVGKTPHDDRFISASSQLLAKRHPDDEHPTVHKGNISGLEPSLQAKLLEYAQQVAHWMRSYGAFGIVGLDFIVTKKEEIYIMEANYRVNGGLAAAMKGHDLHSPYWAANGGVKVPTNTTLNTYIQHLQKNGIEYNPSTNSGVIILNSATSPAGTIQTAILGKTKHHILDIMSTIDMK